MIKISVIVAVYQVEHYINRCLESIRNQTFCDFEVILVDDGSIDNSGRICDEFVKKDDRFKVYHKDNGGVSLARQFGLDQSLGEYIIHVDPDDWIEPNMLEELYETAKKNNADLVICDYYNETEKNVSYIRQKPDISTEKSYFRHFLGQLQGFCWNKLVRRSCFFQYNVSFPKEMSLWEDRYVNMRLAENPIKIAYLPKAFYHYIARKGSAIRCLSSKNVYSIVFFIEWLKTKEDYCDENDIKPLKIYAKRLAFETKSLKTSEFVNLYPEINDSLNLKKSTTDLFIRFSLKFSANFFRNLYFFYLVIRSKMGIVWRK